MISKIKNLINCRKDIFNKICSSNNLSLDYRNNQTEIGILKDIFCNREYSDYFPFYKKATVVDIGAHFGYFSIFAANNLDKDSRIIAVEPNRTNFEHLVRNISDSKIGNISPYNYAVGNRTGITRLYEGKNPNHSIIDNYLLINNKKFEEVEMKKFEDMVHELELDQIDFLKMDCEGAEYTIFNSTPDSIFDRISTISLEFHDLKDKNLTADYLIERLIENKFSVVRFRYEKTSMNLNYGKIIGTKKFVRKS